MDFKDFILNEEPEFKTLKKNKRPLSDEEREIVMKSKAVWHPGNHDKPVAAVWKSVVNGDVWYGSNTHRAYDCSKTLKGAIGRFKDFIKGTS